jgi:hypothetical protein
MNGCIDHLYTRLGTTSNYRAITNLHNTQITTTPTKFLQPLCSPAFPWQRLLTVEFLQLHALRYCLHSLSCRTAYQLTTDLVAPTVKITPRHGPHREHHSIVACVFVAVGTCLPSCCCPSFQQHYIHKFNKLVLDVNEQ